MWPRSSQARLQQKQKYGRPVDPMGLRLYVVEATGWERSQADSPATIKRGETHGRSAQRFYRNRKRRGTKRGDAQVSLTNEASGEEAELALTVPARQ